MAVTYNLDCNPIYCILFQFKIVCLLGTDKNVNNDRMLLKELKETKNAPPAPVVSKDNEEDELGIFMSYLKSRIIGLPKNVIINLQDKFLALIKKEYNNLSR